MITAKYAKHANFVFICSQRLARRDRPAIHIAADDLSI